MGGAAKVISQATGIPLPSGGGGGDGGGDGFFGGLTNFVSNTVKSVGNAVTNIIKNPLPTIETIALSAAGVPAPISSAIVTGMNGGTPAQMLTAAVASSVPSMGSSISTQLGVSSQVGTAIASTGVQVAMGVPLDKALANATVSAVASGAKPAVAAEISNVVNSPAITNAIADAALAAGKVIATGGSADAASNAITSSLANSTVNAGISAGTSAVKSALAPAATTPTAYTPPPQSDIASIIANSPAVQASTSPINAATPEPVTTSPAAVETSPLDLIGSPSSKGLIPTTTPAEPTSPIDTSFAPNYSLLSSATPKLGIDPTTGTGLTTKPESLGASDVGYSPVDYSLTDPSGLADGVGLQMPNTPAIKSMGGAQGLTVDVTNPVTGSTGVVGGLGYTPSTALASLGDPNSFINQNNTIATDPAYSTSPSLKTVLGGLSTPSSTQSGAQTKTAAAATPKSTYSTPLDAAGLLDSYLNTTGATDAEAMAKLKQLFPNLTPDMAKILMERAGITPSMLMSSDTPAADVQSAGSPDLSATALANIGQPDEFAQYAAKGGSMKSPKGHRPEFITGKTGHYAQGRGTGQSDDIPATLHDGDYVVDADTVAALGDGSSKAGAGALEQFRRGLPEHRSGGGQPIPAQIADGEYVLPAGFVTTLGHGSNKQGAKMLDAMREQIRAHKRSAPDTKIPPKARSPLQYMNEAMKG